MNSNIPPRGPGEVLRAVRLFRGLPRVELARRAGMHPDRLALLEGAIGRPTFEELNVLWETLCKASPPSDLLPTPPSDPVPSAPPPRTSERPSAPVPRKTGRRG